MPHEKTYHRPTTLAEALRLLARPGLRTVPLAGGVALVPRLKEEADEVVDLQALGLDGIRLDGDRLTLGAMVRLQTLVEDDRIPPLLREAAHREGPNTFRNAGTLGGVIATADWESELLAALLVFQADVTIETQAGRRTLPLADFLADVPAALGNGLLTAVALPTGGETAADRVARTPADKPIVAALARRDAAGRIHLALCGVAATPVRVEPGEVDALSPPADFRGSAEYRRQMAMTLSRRVLARLSDGA